MEEEGPWIEEEDVRKMRISMKRPVLELVAGGHSGEERQEEY